MQVKMSEIIDLEKVYEKIGKQTISIKTAYKISKFFNAAINPPRIISKYH